MDFSCIQDRTSYFESHILIFLES
uniref:Uncharacterized protein n=1 Tax=Anguilla anguilla TaxID=7936 RepID=A0A0E9VU06_ANGAN